MIEKLPDEIVNPIIEVLSYVFTFITGAIARWLLGRNRKPKNNQT